MDQDRLRRDRRVGRHITPPTLELVTLADANAHLRIDGDDDDTFLGGDRCGIGDWEIGEWD